MTFNYPAFIASVKNTLKFTKTAHVCQDWGKPTTQVTSEKEAKKWFVKAFIKNC